MPATAMSMIWTLAAFLATMMMLVRYRLLTGKIQNTRPRFFPLSVPMWKQ